MFIYLKNQTSFLSYFTVHFKKDFFRYNYVYIFFFILLRNLCYPNILSMNKKEALNYNISPLYGNALFPSLSIQVIRLDSKKERRIEKIFLKNLTRSGHKSDGRKIPFF